MAAPTLGRRLQLWRLERALSISADAGARLAAGPGALLLAALILDLARPLPPQARWTAFGLLGAALAAGAYRHLLRRWRLLGAASVLAEAGKRFPRVAAHLRPAWELSRAGSAQAGVSPALAREHVERTERLLAALPPGPALGRGPSPDALRGLLLSAAAWAAAGPWLYLRGARPDRILAPWRDSSLDALVSVRPGDARVPAGAPLVLRAGWRVPRPGEPLTLEVRENAGPWEAAAEGPAPSLEARSVTAPLEYRAASRGLRTRTFTILPAIVPSLEGLTARVAASSLPGAEALEVPLDGASEIPALRGSWVTVLGRPRGEVERAELEVSFLGKVPMRRLDSGELAAGFPLRESGELRVLLSGPDGLADPAPPAYELRALEDRPPSVELLSPAFEVEASPRERLPVTFSAKDDSGLVSASFSWRGPDGVERRAPIRSWSPPAREALGEYSWDLSAFPAGARVEFWVSATDDARPRPQTGSSARGALRIMDFDAAHAQGERQAAAAEAALRALAGKEAALRSALRGSSRNWRDLEGEAEAAWPAALRALAAAASSLSQDPLAAPGSAETASALSKGLEESSSALRSAARRAAQAGNLAGAERSRAGLEAGLRRAADALSEGRELQSMRDFWAEAYRMSQSAQELGRALERAGRLASARDKAAVEQAMAELRRQALALAEAVRALPAADPGSARDMSRRIYSLPLEAVARGAAALKEAVARGDYAEAARLARELSGRLSDLRGALSRAAGEAAARGPKAEDLARLSELESAWGEASASQSRALEASQREEAAARAARDARAEDLLRALAKRQREALEDVSRIAAAPLSALKWMRRALDEFEALRAREAPRDLENAASALEESAGPRGPASAAGGDAARRLRRAASVERDILEKLRGNPSGAPASPGGGEAAAEQGRAGRKAGELESRAAPLASEGLLPRGALDRVLAARAEQAGAASALERRDPAAAISRQQKALDELEEGLRALSKAARDLRRAQEGAAGALGSERPIVRAVSASAGGVTGFVPLPRAEDFEPSRELRRELEKSLRERRPRVFDEEVKEYLRRMSQ